VELTKEKAYEILAARTENERKLQEWSSIAEHEAMQRALIQKQNLEMEEQSRRIRKIQSKEVLKKKQTEVEFVRELSHQNRQISIKLKEDDIKRKRELREKVREQEEQARIKREQEKLEHDRKVREYYEQKAREEEEEARKAEALVKALEEKEKEWIERLQLTQKIQENAFVELETVLTRDLPENFEKTETIQNASLNSSKSSSGGPFRIKTHEATDKSKQFKIKKSR
jgi:hypothetical protein